MTRLPHLLILACLSGCDLADLLGGEPDGKPGKGKDTTEVLTSENPTNPNSPPPAAAGWTVRRHTCSGDGIDAMWIDADGQNIWIGCGTNSSGYGLHHSPDRGETWPDVNTEPRGASGGRVNAISRSSDGLLYIAGDQLLGGQVVALDTSSDTYNATVVYDAGNSIDDVHFAGSFARNDDGMAVVESANGTALNVRWSETGSWRDGSGWGGGANFQMQHLLVHDNQFYGTGSIMTQAPMVFLPPQSGHSESAGFMLVVVELSQYAQELRNLDVDSAGNMITGGIDHGAASGVIYLSNSDPRNAADWTEVWVEDILGTDATWIDGVCREGNTVAAVGRHSRNDDPIALLSTDGGVTFQDIAQTLNADNALYRCEFLDNGRTLAVGGAGGFLGFYGF